MKKNKSIQNPQNNGNNVSNNNTNNQSMDQLLVKLGWSNREVLSGYIALYTITRSVIVRSVRRAAVLDDINGTSFTKNPEANYIIENYPSFITETFLILAIQSVELSFEQLIYNLNWGTATEQEIKDIKDGLLASFLAYLAAKISNDVEIRAPFY